MGSVTPVLTEALLKRFALLGESLFSLANSFKSSIFNFLEFPRENVFDFLSFPTAVKFNALMSEFPRENWPFLESEIPIISLKRSTDDIFAC